MTQLVASQRRSEQGFTLVELAIVMVIIGLLIGGILKGQELISTAKVGATVSQIKALDGAINTFQEKYAAYPGDMLNPNLRIPNCTAAPCNVAGNGNSQIVNGAITTMGNAPVAPNGATGEGSRAFSHLALSDLLSGIDPNETASVFGASLPVVKAGGGMWIGYTSQATSAGIATLTAGRHYAMLNATPVTMAVDTGAFNSNIAAQIDRKIDDGIANRGGAQTIGTGCADTTSGVYNEATPGGACAMYIRILN